MLISNKFRFGCHVITQENVYSKNNAIKYGELVNTINPNGN